MRVTRTTVSRVCAICERSLLMGERVTRFSPHGDGGLVDVCPLCTETAHDHGWVKEGSPTTPTLPDRRRRRRGGLGRWLDDLRRPALPAPVVAEPILRRLSDDELAIVDAADVFNGSDYRRTVGGIAKSLGAPRASIVQLAGVNSELVITVAWDISWYQYRVSPDAPQPVRLEQRGHDLAGLSAQYQAWNAHLEDDGRVVPEIERIWRVDDKGYRVKRVDEIPLIPPETSRDPEWRPVQHHLRLSAFGANVYVARDAGVVLVSRHDERDSGQEELYFVVAGRVRFTLDGDEFDAREGTVVTAEPQVVREGIAMEPGSAVFAVGAAPPPGRRFQSSWDARWFTGVPQDES